MNHYSIRGTDIQLEKLETVEGWHIGDELKYLVKNGSWCSKVSFHPQFSEFGPENLLAQIIFLAGDKEKLQRDQDIILLILREILENQNISLMDSIQ